MPNNMEILFGYSMCFVWILWEGYIVFIPLLNIRTFNTICIIKYYLILNTTLFVFLGQERLVLSCCFNNLSRLSLFSHKMHNTKKPTGIIRALNGTHYADVFHSIHKTELKTRRLAIDKVFRVFHKSMFAVNTHQISSDVKCTCVDPHLRKDCRKSVAESASQCIVMWQRLHQTFFMED